MGEFAELIGAYDHLEDKCYTCGKILSSCKCDRPEQQEEDWEE